MAESATLTTEYAFDPALLSTFAHNLTGEPIDEETLYDNYTQNVKKKPGTVIEQTERVVRNAKFTSPKERKIILQYAQKYIASHISEIGTDFPVEIRGDKIFFKGEDGVSKEISEQQIFNIIGAQLEKDAVGTTAVFKSYMKQDNLPTDPKIIISDTLSTSRSKDGKSQKVTAYMLDGVNLGSGVPIKVGGMEKSQEIVASNDTKNLISIVQDGKILGTIERNGTGTKLVFKDEEFKKKFADFYQAYPDGKKQKFSMSDNEIPLSKVEVDSKLDVRVGVANTDIAALFTAYGSQIVDNEKHSAVHRGKSPISFVISDEFKKDAFVGKNGCSINTDKVTTAVETLLVSQMIQNHKLKKPNEKITNIKYGGNGKREFNLTTISTETYKRDASGYAIDYDQNGKPKGKETADLRFMEVTTPTGKNPALKFYCSLEVPDAQNSKKHEKVKTGFYDVLDIEIFDNENKDATQYKDIKNMPTKGKFLRVMVKGEGKGKAYALTYPITENNKELENLVTNWQKTYGKESLRENQGAVNASNEEIALAKTYSEGEVASITKSKPKEGSPEHDVVDNQPFTVVYDTERIIERDYDNLTEVRPDPKIQQHLLVISEKLDELTKSQQELRDEQKRLADEQRQLTEENKEAQGKLDKVLEENKKAQENVSKELQQVNTAISELKKNLSGLKENVGGMKEQMTNIDNAIKEKAQKDADEFAKVHQEIDEHRKETEKGFSEVHKNINETKEKITNLEGKVDEGMEKIDNLQSYTQQIDQDIKDYQARTNENFNILWKVTKDEINKSADDIRNEINQSTQNIRDKIDQTRDDLSREMQDIKDSVEENHNLVQDIGQDVRNLSNSVAQNSRDINSLTSGVNELKRLTGEAVDASTAAQKSSIRTESAVANLEKKFTEYQKETDQKIQQLLEGIQQLSEKIDSLSQGGRGKDGDGQTGGGQTGGGDGQTGGGDGQTGGGQTGGDGGKGDDGKGSDGLTTGGGGTTGGGTTGGDGQTGGGDGGKGDDGNGGGGLTEPPVQEPENTDREYIHQDNKTFKEKEKLKDPDENNDKKGKKPARFWQIRSFWVTAGILTGILSVFIPIPVFLPVALIGLGVSRFWTWPKRIKNAIRNIRNKFIDKYNDNIKQNQLTRNKLNETAKNANIERNNLNRTRAQLVETAKALNEKSGNRRLTQKERKNLEVKLAKAKERLKKINGKIQEARTVEIENLKSKLNLINIEEENRKNLADARAQESALKNGTSTYDKQIKELENQKNANNSELDEKLAYINTNPELQPLDAYSPEAASMSVSEIEEENKRREAERKQQIAEFNADYDQRNGLIDSQIKTIQEQKEGALKTASEKVKFFNAKVSEFEKLKTEFDGIVNETTRKNTLDLLESERDAVNSEIEQISSQISHEQFLDTMGVMTQEQIDEAKRLTNEQISAIDSRLGNLAQMGTNIGQARKLLDNPNFQFTNNSQIMQELNQQMDDNYYYSNNPNEVMDKAKAVIANSDRIGQIDPQLQSDVSKFVIPYLQDYTPTGKTKNEQLKSVQDRNQQITKNLDIIEQNYMETIRKTSGDDVAKAYHELKRLNEEIRNESDPAKQAQLKTEEAKYLDQIDTLKKSSPEKRAELEKHDENLNVINTMRANNRDKANTATETIESNFSSKPQTRTRSNTGRSSGK